MYGRYGAKKCVVNGITFDSEMEAQYYTEQILPRLKAKEITDLILQPEFILIPDFEKNGKMMKGIKYIADFQFYDLKEDKIRVIDVKGMETEEFILRRKLFDFRYSRTDLEVITYAKYCGWVTTERLKELIRVRKRYNDYVKELKQGKSLSKMKLINMKKIEQEYAPYIKKYETEVK